MGEFCSVPGIGLYLSLAGTRHNKTKQTPTPNPKEKKKKSLPIIPQDFISLQIHKGGKFDFVLLGDGWSSCCMWVCLFYFPVAPCLVLLLAFLGLLHAYSFNHFSHILEPVTMCHTRSPYLNFQKTSNRLLEVCHFVSKISKYCDKWNDSTEFSQPGCRPGEWGVTDRNRCYPRKGLGADSLWRAAPQGS